MAIQVMAAVAAVNGLSSLTASATERGYQAALAGDQAGEAAVRAKLAQYAAQAYRAQLAGVDGGRAFVAAWFGQGGIKGASAKQYVGTAFMANVYVNQYATWLKNIYAAWDSLTGAAAVSLASASAPAVTVSSSAPTSGALTSSSSSAGGTPLEQLTATKVAGVPVWVLAAGAVALLLVMRGRK